MAAPGWRVVLEWGLRVAALALLLWTIRAEFTPAAADAPVVLGADDLTSRLPGLTLAQRPLHVSVDRALRRSETGWLNALRRGGVPVTWSGSVPAAALAAEPVPDPQGAVRVDLAAPARSMVHLGDDAGPVDSVRIARAGATLGVPMLAGSPHARLAGADMRSAVLDSIELRPVLIVGNAGWEGKYVAASLEERGWQVATQFSVAPGVVVSQGVVRVDTSRYSAVIALDTAAAAMAAELHRFVRAGGGLVLAGSAARAPALAAFAPARIRERHRPDTRPDSVRAVDLAIHLLALGDGAEALERRDGGAVTVAVRRSGAGRVAQVATDESWRWRMGGAAGSDEAHRLWWSRIVSAVAYAPPAARAGHGTDSMDDAPLARMVAALGPQSPAPEYAAPDAPDARLIFTMIALLLLAEWASRRLRGAR